MGRKVVVMFRVDSLGWVTPAQALLALRNTCSIYVELKFLVFLIIFLGKK